MKDFKTILVLAPHTDDGINSFLYDTEEELEAILIRIFEGKINLDEMGNKAYEKILQHYTFTANKEKYLWFFS